MLVAAMENLPSDVRDLLRPSRKLEVGILLVVVDLLVTHQIFHPLAKPTTVC